MRSRRGLTGRRWVLSFCALAAVVIGGGWIVNRFLSQAVTTTDVMQGPVVQAFYSTGTIQPQREYPIRSNMAGLLREVRVDKGSHVKTGDVLAVVEDPALVFAQQKAQAELDEKLHRADEKSSPVLQELDAKMTAMNDMLDIAQREQKRVANLVASNSGSQIDLDRAMDRVKQCWSDLESFKGQRAAKVLEMNREVEVAHAALDTAKWNVDELSLRAPIDGVVLDRPTSLGTRVAINDQIMRIADVRPENLVMRAAVDEEDIVKVAPKQTVRMTLYAFADETFSGRVTRIYDQADPDRRTFEVEVNFEKLDARFSPGMTGELAFVMAEKPSAMIVPAQALQAGNIWLVRDGRLVKTTPKIGIKSVERVEVLSDLKTGDQVVISPIPDGTDGEKVRAKWTDPHVAAAVNKPPPMRQAFKSFSK